MHGFMHSIHATVVARGTLSVVLDQTFAALIRGPTDAENRVKFALLGAAVVFEITLAERRVGPLLGDLMQKMDETLVGAAAQRALLDGVFDFCAEHSFPPGIFRLVLEHLVSSQLVRDDEAYTVWRGATLVPTITMLSRAVHPDTHGMPAHTSLATRVQLEVPLRPLAPLRDRLEQYRLFSPIPSLSDDTVR